MTTTPSMSTASDQTVTSIDGPRPTTTVSEPVVRELGRYVVLESIGSGGMGLVLRAYDPKLQREVALKQLRSDALDERAADRMLREAQAMAQLAHPNVVAVHDVEVLDPTVLLVMEYVPGRTLRAWLREEEPEWTRIVEAFVQAGRGLAAAHDAGLVHRDFKPTNVLVGLDGRVRVTDFGLARAMGEPEPPPSASVGDSRSPTGSHRSLQTVMTVEGTVMGTPPYMAPEQHMGEETTPGTDQFCFCVALWEALTGARPYQGEYKALVKAKLAGPPTWPRDSPVPRRVVDAVTRGLAPEVGDRWPSMDVLLQQLDPEPPRDRRLQLMAGALGVTVATTAALVWGLADRDPPVCRGARDHLRGIWDDERREAVASSLRATGLPYVEDTLAPVTQSLDDYADAWVAMHTEACEATSVRAEQSPEVLDLRMACLAQRRNELDATTEVLLDADAATVERAASLAAGLPRLARCADIPALRAAVPPPEDPARAAVVERAQRDLAHAHARGEAGRQLDALTMLDALPREALAHPPFRVEVASERGHLLLGLARYEEAETVLAEAYPVAIQSGDLVVAAELLGQLLFVVGGRLMREEEAHWLSQTALALARREGNDDLVAVILSDMAAVFQTHAKTEQAVEYFERVLELQIESVDGRPSPAVASTLSNLSISLQSLGDFERSQAMQEQALAMERELFGQQHPYIARSLYALGNLRHLRGDHQGAAELHEQALEMRIHLLGREHPDTAHSMTSVGMAYTRMGRYEEAEAHIRQGLEILERQIGTDTIEVNDTIGNLAVILEDQGRYEEALELHRRVLATAETLMGPDHPRTATARSNVGGALIALRRAEEALPLLERAVETMTARAGPQHPHAAIFDFNLGDALLQLERYDEAEARFRKALPIIETAFGPDHVYLSYVLVGLGRVLVERGDQLTDARALLERALRIRRKEKSPRSKQAEAAFALARALWPDPAERDRARKLAQEARESFAASGPGHVVDRDEVRAWLERHEDP